MQNIDIVCNSVGCVGWSNAVDIMNKSSNKPLSTLCRCNYPSPKCISCDKNATFGYVGYKRRLTCKPHSNNKMSNVAHKLCPEQGCKKRPMYNYPDKVRGVLCFDHKKERMIDLTARKCAYKGCTKQPSCNFPGETKKLYCGGQKWYLFLVFCVQKLDVIKPQTITLQVRKFLFVAMIINLHL